jgi:hypothetical protein
VQDLRFHANDLRAAARRSVLLTIWLCAPRLTLRSIPNLRSVHRQGRTPHCSHFCQLARNAALASARSAAVPLVLTSARGSTWMVIDQNQANSGRVGAHLVEAADWLEVVPHGVVVQGRASRVGQFGQFPARGFASRIAPSIFSVANWSRSASICFTVRGHRWSMRAAARLLLGRAEWSSAYYRLARYRTT